MPPRNMRCPRCHGNSKSPRRVRNGGRSAASAALPKAIKQLAPSAFLGVLGIKNLEPSSRSLDAVGHKLMLGELRDGAGCSHES
jgi:hypothetical protein